MARTDEDVVDYCSRCGRRENECEADYAHCADVMAKRVHALCLEYMARWAAIKEECGIVPMHVARKADGVVKDMVTAATDLEGTISEIIEDEDYVVAYGEDQVLLVGNNEDGLYCVERPLIHA